MSFFTLIYVTPIIGLIYYLFFWSQENRGTSCVLNRRKENYEVLLTAV